MTTSTTTTDGPAVRATYAALFAVGEFRVLFGGTVLRILSETASMLALSVLVYSATGSAALAAVAFTATFVPQAVGGAFLLALADRLPPRGAIVAGALVRAGVVLAVAALPLPVPAVLALVLVSSVGTPVFSAASSGLVADVLTGDRYVLGRATTNMATAGAQIGSLGAGGVLLAVLGPHATLYAAAGLALLGAAWTRFGLRPRPPRHVDDRPLAARLRTTVADSLRGNGELLADRPLRDLLLAQWLPVSLLTGAESVVVPYTAGLPGGTANAGLVLAALPVGMLAGGYLVGRWLPPGARVRASLPLALLLGLPLLVLAVRPPWPVAAGLLGLASVGLAYDLGLQPAFLAALPDAARGQGFGLLSTGVMTGQGLGALAVGALADAWSPAAAMAAAGVAVLLVVAGLARPFLAAARTPRVPAAPEPPGRRPGEQPGRPLSPPPSPGRSRRPPRARRAAPARPAGRRSRR